MIPPAVVLAFLVGLLAEATVLYVLDRRAIRREADYWAELSAQALDGYGRVFDWADDDA